MSKKGEQLIYKESETMRMLGVTRPTLKEYVHLGHIKALRVPTKTGRLVNKFTREAIDEFIERFQG
jgi:excisionase family DNA binding protein